LHEELMARVLDRANLQRAWKRVKANKGAPGIDGMCIEDFTAFAQSHWPSIRQQLADGTYQPQPVRRVCIPKPQGGERLLGIPTVTDRVLERRGHRFARYADDLVILVRSQRAGERVKTSVTAYLTGQLKLTVNERKSRVVKTNDCEFLGFTFRGTKLRWSDRAFADFKHHVRRLTGRSRGVSMAYRLGKLAQYVRGWMGYFGISDYYRPIPEIDHWLRRRLRMCYWKQWRYVRTKVRNLLALGTFKRQAILTALSSKSYWRLSRTLATQSGMTNEWLKRQGLISVRDRWMKTHGYA
jgi:RNA-directed DNA polymerase